MFAYELSPAIRVGAGLRIQHLDLSLTSTIDAGGIAAASLIPGFAPSSDDLAASFEADAVALGFTVGAQADLTPSLSVGASYSSKVEHDVEGEAEFDLQSSLAAQTLNAAAGLFSADGFSTALATPAIAAAGVRYQATEQLTLLASTKVIFWSSFDVVALDFNDGATPTEVLTQNWRDSWSVSLGVEYQASGATALRGGLMYDESPVNAEFASPRIPDGDRHWAALGASHAFSQNFSADVGVAYAFFSDRPIDLDGAAPENLFRGGLAADFTTDVYAGSLRVRWKF
jgi:long-chain fatty acid transport protein